MKYQIIIAYDCKLGARNEVVSTHKSYELAEKAAKKTGYYDFLKIVIID